MRGIRDEALKLRTAFTRSFFRLSTAFKSKRGYMRHTFTARSASY